MPLVQRICRLSRPRLFSLKTGYKSPKSTLQRHDVHDMLLVEHEVDIVAARLPFFFENTKDPNLDLQLCRKMMRILFQNKIMPIPFASTLQEMDEVLKSLADRKTPPAIFIVNTLGSEEILMELDKRMGDMPVLFLRRGLAADKRVKDLLENPGSDGVSSVLSGMRPRPAAVWGFGSKNSDEIASFASRCLIQFLADGEFWHIEGQTHYSISSFHVAG
jgi:hypothetical protein